MGLNPRGRGRGRGGKGNFNNKGRRGGGMGGPGPMFRPGPPGMFCPPPMGFPPEPPFGGPFFGGPSGFNFGPPRGGFGKYPRKNFKRKAPPKTNDAPVPEIDLTKPWVTEEIKNEETKKQELLETWRKSKNDEDWSKYKAQKQSVQTLYDKAKEEYIANHPEEAVLWQNVVTFRRYYCEMCDKSFRTDDDLILHEEEHEVCGREGCDFTAHPKIIAKHIKMQHDSGLYKRIGKLYTEEDIAKWIEERKKRYPSRKVVEEKKLLEQEKINRGEKLKDDDSKFNKSFQNKNNKKVKKTFEKRTQRITKKRPRKKKNGSAIQSLLEEEVVSNFRKGVPAFGGIKGASEPDVPDEQDDLHISDDDNEWDRSIESTKPTKVILNNSLGLLASCYDSDEEIVSKDSQKENKNEGSGDEAPEEVKTICSKETPKEDNSENKRLCHKRKFAGKKGDFKKRRDNNYNQCNSDSKTLLEKLLKNEIRHERNVILQCVHYAVKNNFFKT